MTDDTKRFLFELLNTPSPTGFERPGQRVWLDYVRQFADVVELDAYGTAWATCRGTSTDLSVMLEAHADEIGLMIQNISEDGFLYLTRIGGSDRAIARGKRLTIFGDQGPVLGVVGNTAIHLREKDDEKIPEWHQLFVDIGASTRSEVEARGIRTGHPAVYVDQAAELTPTRIVGRAIDNRISGFIISQVLANLASRAEKPAATLLAVNAIQEEIGGAGAKMISYRLNPQIALVLDVTHATDSPGIDRNKHGTTKLGGGPALTHGTANHPLIVERLIAIAKELDLPIQHEASSRSTGTDTDLVYSSRTGIPSALVSIPLRYMHSTVEMVDLADVERCIRLLTAFLEGMQDAAEFSWANV
jgi:putative aminopeptidase FrvX